MQAVIRCASKEDLNGLREFLTRANLGCEGLTEETVEFFLLLEDESGQILGTLGMEVFAECGLLRSLVVSKGQAEKDIVLLITQIMQLAKEKGLRDLFLATNKGVAMPFFELLGFEKVARDQLPVEMFSLEHIRHVFNVDNSLFLKFSL